MQAIEVKETVDRNGNHRLRAACAAGSSSFYRDHLCFVCHDRKIPITQDTLAALAAEHLKNKLGWNDSNYGRLVMGTLKNGNYVFVFTGQQEIAHTGKKA